MLTYLAWAFRVAGRPTLGLRCADGKCGDRGERRHETRMKNAAGLGSRQRRHLQAMLGRLARLLDSIKCFKTIRLALTLVC